MILEMKVPSPGESITEVEIANWLVKNGDYVKKDQIIAEIDSDKATLEITAEESGVIILKVKEGDLIKVGAIICLIDTSKKQDPASGLSLEEEKEVSQKEIGIAISSKKESKESYATGTPSPSARKILNEKNIDISHVKGTGRDNRITKEDANIAVPAMGISLGNRNSERVKMSMLRRKISQRLVSVKNETAMLTTFNEVNMQSILDLREQYKEHFKTKHDVNLGFMSFFTLASIRALKLFPDVNSMIDGDYQIKNEFIDISIAVSAPNGLMIPVLRNAENLSFKGVELQIKQLAIKAREGKISVDEMTGGTFTITNGGIFGSMLSTPIINPPQSAILGMHNIINRPMAYHGQVVIQSMMYLALSYDHRIIDGKESVGFLIAIKEAIENPIELLMDNDPERSLEL